MGSVLLFVLLSIAWFTCRKLDRFKKGGNKVAKTSRFLIPILAVVATRGSTPQLPNTTQHTTATQGI